MQSHCVFSFFLITLKCIDQFKPNLINLNLKDMKFLHGTHLLEAIFILHKTA